MAEISIVELMKDVERIEKEQREKQQDGFTTTEYAEAMKIPADRARAQITMLIRAGKLQPISVPRTSIMTGHTRRLPGFVVIRKGKR